MLKKSLKKITIVCRVLVFQCMVLRGMNPKRTQGMVTASSETGIRSKIFRYQQKKDVEQGFTSFFDKCLPYIFQSVLLLQLHVSSTLKKKIIIYDSLSKNEEKPSSTCLKKLFLYDNDEDLKLGFQAHTNLPVWPLAATGTTMTVIVTPKKSTQESSSVVDFSSHAI